MNMLYVGLYLYIYIYVCHTYMHIYAMCRTRWAGNASNGKKLLDPHDCICIAVFFLVTNIFFKLSRKTVIGLFPADNRCAYFPAILKICNIPSEKIFLIRNVNKCGEIPKIVSATCQSQLCNLIWLIGATISQIHSNINMCHAGLL